MWLDWNVMICCCFSFQITLNKIILRFEVLAKQHSHSKNELFLQFGVIVKFFSFLYIMLVKKLQHLYQTLISEL